MVLKVRNLSKSFKNIDVLKEINFELKSGEVLVLLGQSGAGKTTILRCINGLEKCDRGTIEIDGMCLCEDKNGRSIYPSQNILRNIRRNVGMVFQSFNLFPHMSVIENVIEGPVNTNGIPRNEAEKSAIELLDRLGLKDKAYSYPCELSGGQKQRAAIARALALNPKIMCFDEPTSALDPELTGGIASIIKGLAKDGMGILIITHDMFFSEMVADRVIRVEKGCIV